LRIGRKSSELGLPGKMALPIIDLTSATVRPVDISTDSNRYDWMGKGDFG